MDYPDKLAPLYEACALSKDVKGKRIVIKYGGAAMKEQQLTVQVIKNITLLQELGLRCILVHGGGPAINQWLDKLRIEPQFDRGIRVTDKQTMEVVQMVLAGQVNKNLVGLLNINDLKAIGLSGHDDSLIKALPINEEDDNRVANVESINVNFLNLLLNNGYLPVIAPIGVTESGLAYNINADVLASAVASELHADMLIMLTDTPGILRDCSDVTTLLDKLTVSEVDTLIQEGIVSGGMIPKVNACLNALCKGVGITKIIDGRKPNTLLLSLMNEPLSGTSIISG
uniref:Acetylglutamate kinase n=1 Tax=Izziella formosana TaxID=1653389 RepID=A0A1G4NUR7_9FLOR|nr:Acetylglutamate kinase [Izziella formosana]SCW22443.1 Acetylglutamate kinase [Izziella formosana]